MKNRLNPFSAAPDAYKAVVALEQSEGDECIEEIAGASRVEPEALAQGLGGERS